MRFVDLAKDLEDKTLTVLDRNVQTVFNEILNEMDNIVPVDKAILQKNQRERSTLFREGAFKYRMDFKSNLVYAKKVYYVTAKTGSLKWIEVAVRNKKKDIPNILRKR